MLPKSITWWFSSNIMIEPKSNYDTDPFQAFSSIKCLPGIGSIAVQKVLLQLPPLQRISPTLTLSSR